MAKQKKSNIEEYWVKNPTRYDIGIGDLRCKVHAGTAVDLYKMSPAITEELVAKSEKSGALKLKLDEKKLIKIDGPTIHKPVLRTTTLDHTFPSNAQRGSIVIDNDDSADEFVEEEFDLDDYYEEQGDAKNVPGKTDDGVVAIMPKNNGKEGSSDKILDAMQSQAKISKDKFGSIVVSNVGSNEIKKDTSAKGTKKQASKKK